LNKYPLIGFVIIFIAGIIVQSVFNYEITFIIILAAAFLVATITFKLIQHNKTEYLKNCALYLTVLFFGAAYFCIFGIGEVKYPFEKPKIKGARIVGSIDDIDLKREGRLSFTVITDSVIIQNEVRPVTITTLCSVYDNERKLLKLYNDLAIGYEISLKGIIQKPRDERNPGEFDHEKYLYSKEISAVCNAYSADSLRIVSYTKKNIPDFISQIRKSISHRIGMLHNHTTSGILRGLLLADRGLIDYEIKSEFVNAGVIHVLAVSGLHVGYIVLIFAALFNRFNIRLKLILTMIGLLFFLIITGSPPSVFRATVMAGVLLVGKLSGRDYNSINAISLAALIILLINPEELFNPGFQLSFSAVLSIIILYPYLSRLINRWKIKTNIFRWLLLFFAVSLSAQIGTLPFTLVYFNKLSVVALLANLIVIPMIGIIVAMAFLVLFISVISFGFAAIMAQTTELFTYTLYLFVHMIGDEKFSYIMINQFSLFDAIVFYGILMLLFYIFIQVKKPFAVIISVFLSLILAALLMRIDNYKLMPENILSVMAIDVGQGDSFLIKFPNGKTALVDAGNKTTYFDNGGRIIIPLLDKLEIDTLDYAFVSHVDSDHYKGFESLITKKRIRNIYKPPVDTSSSSDVDFEELLNEYNYKPEYYSKKYFSLENTRIYVLNDTINNYFGNRKSNDRSGIFKLVYGNTSFLFTGDAEVKVEKDYATQYGTFLRSDVLKAGHHGSRTSTGDEFLKLVNPKIALISAGIGNSFNHPHPLILKLLKENGTKILRTDVMGAVLLQSDGEEIRNIDWKRMKAVFNF